MRASFSLLFLLAAGLLAGCAVPVESEASIAMREASWGPIPDYYVWDGYEYVGVYDGGYFYLGPGENWMAFDAFRLNRFRLWCAAHPDWRRHAVPNNHHRKGRDGHVHPPRPDGRRHHPGDWKEPAPAPHNPPPPDRAGDHRDEDHRTDRPQGHHPPAPVTPPAPPRTGPDGTAAHPPQTLNPPKDRPGVQKEKHKHKTKKTPSAPQTGPKPRPSGPPKVTPPPPPAATPPPPPSIKPPTPPATKPQAPKPPAPPKVDPPRQNDKNADKSADDKNGGDRRRPR